MATQTALEVRDVVKTFGSTRALDELTLSVSRGEVHGLLGPNGAGKSTTIRVLLGLLRVDSGTACVLGRDPWVDAVDLHRHLAYVPGDVSLWPQLTGGEAIDLLLRMRGNPDWGRRDDLVERFDFDPRKRCGNYSKGNRQKVALIAALAAGGELLILDEPTSGLDPLMEHVFTDEIRRERDRGRTVLLSSHILSEVEALCDHVSIVRSGRVVDSGTLSQLRHLSRTHIEAVVERPAEVDLDDVPGIHDLDVRGNRLVCQVDNQALAHLLCRLAELGVRSLISTPPSLEELFLQHYDGAR